MNRNIIALAALAALTACSATASTASSQAFAANDSVSEASCEVRLTPTRHGLRIEALAHAPYALAGEYDLVVSKSGPNGSSDVSQGGEFEAEAGEDVTLSATEFNVERGDRYRARLILSDDGAELCRDERRS